MREHQFQSQIAQNVKVLKCHVGHTTILPSAVLLRKLTNTSISTAVKNIMTQFLKSFLGTVRQNEERTEL